MTKQSILFRRGNTWRKALCLLCILGCSLAAAAQKRVSGKVIDAGGESVIGANVMEKGTGNGTITDVDGNFNLTVQGDASVLQISFIGYVTQDIAVGNQTVLNVTLQEDAQALEEVVVVGYGTQKKVNLSGAVATISAKAIENRPVTNANTALQGLSPNLNITRRSGMANMPPEINIRGFTSINGGSAFILVDNVPTTAAEFSRINPADIESVSVLKDASSAAIDGGRAAFGVVLVTTKTAKSEKIQVDADYTYGLRQFDNIPEVMTDIAEYMRLANIMSQNPDRFNDAAIEYGRKRMADPSLPEILGPGAANGGVNDRLGNDGEWEYYGIYDWFDVMLKNVSPNQTANVRISQRGEKLAYSASGGFYKEDGMLTYGNDVLKRFNFRGNATYNMTDRWKFGTNLAFNRQDYNSSLASGENEFWFFRLHSNYPTQPIYNPDGTYTQDGGCNVGSALSGAYVQTIRDETQLSFNTKYDIVKDVWSLNGDVTFRMGFENEDRLNIHTPYQNKPGKQNGQNDPGVEQKSNHDRLTVYNLYTSFNKTFADKHAVSATLGYNQEYYMYNNQSVGGSKLITETLPDVQMALNNRSYTQKLENYALRGVFGRVNYIFDNKYIFEVNGRYDGSSRFSKGSRFGFFPSYSAAWVLSRERFMDGVKETLRLDNLKLRGSYGSLGNQVIKDKDGNEIFYPYISTMNYLSQIEYILDSSRPGGMQAPGAAPESLTWETVRTVNGGIDLGFLNNRLDLTFDVYTRYTEGMLTQSKTLPAVYGTGSPQANAADLKTKGWELSVGWHDAVEVGGSPLSYNIRVMLADNKSWITHFDNPTKNLGNYYEGQRLGEIWGYTTLGYFANDAEANAWADQAALGNSQNNYSFQAGDLKFADLNNDGKITNGNNTVNDPGDMKIIGNNRERLPYSIDAGAAWKGFDLRLFFQGIGKREAYPNVTHDGLHFWGIYTTPWCNPNTKNADNWTPENTDAYFPRLKSAIAMSGELAKTQTKYLQDASYLRLKNVTIGYTIPSQLLQKVKIRNLRVYFSGENLLTFHHIEVKGNDPEKFGGNIYYPFQRTFSFGVNIGF
ncbi:MAG: TonB-dependent receptor [Tannerella sp.]|jgi:TonB-linked SusC/RagA family outer membrane protein|nr:TonB-dependent receptor [Tannerella sp.]